MKYTTHFQEDVLTEHPEANRSDWIDAALANPVLVREEANGTIRHWGFIAEANKFMRVVTKADRETLITAFFDEGFTNRKLREAQWLT